MKKESVGTTKNGCAVWVDRKDSHAATHLRDTPWLLELVKEALVRSDPKGEYCALEQDMGRVIGTTDCVETEKDEEIVYALRPNRKIFSRFVKNRIPEPTSFVTLHLQRTGEKEYQLFSAWTGKLAPAFPGDLFEIAESKPFWEKHALVWGRQEVVPGTETTICPW